MKKSSYNIFEILILVLFTIGIGNLIFTFFGIVESIIGFIGNNVSYFFALSYSTWAIGNFFNKNKFMSYFKGFLAYLFGTTMGSFLIILVGLVIDAFSKSS